MLKLSFNDALFLSCSPFSDCRGRYFGPDFTTETLGRASPISTPLFLPPPVGYTVHTTIAYSRAVMYELVHVRSAEWRDAKISFCPYAIRRGRSRTETPRGNNDVSNKILSHMSGKYLHAIWQKWRSTSRLCVDLKLFHPGNNSILEMRIMKSLPDVSPPWVFSVSLSICVYVLLLLILLN